VKYYNFRVSPCTGFRQSAMTETLEHGILIGRPFGGVCTLIKNSIVSNAEILLCSDRSVIVRIGLLAFINVYLPCTSKHSLVLIEEILAEIWVIIVKKTFCFSLAVT